MKPINIIQFVLSALLIVVGSTSAQAWGGRGHDIICEVATNLVKNEGLKNFLKHRSHTMGHLCNIPDIYWKSLNSETRKYGDPTHYIDPEVIGLKVNEIPTDYKKIVADYSDKNNKFTDSKIRFLPNEFGSNWWRVDQFMKRIAARKESFTQALSDAQSTNSYSDLVYSTILDMGIMGHFVGDNAQPYHTSADYDGYKAGHGGIHSYYEESVVAEFGADLGALILKQVPSVLKDKKMKTVLNQKTTVEKMRALAEISHSEIEQILKKDPIIKKSEEKEEKGMKLRTAAERKSAAEGLKVFGSMITTDMARGAILLAQLWDEAYEEINKPDLKKYSSFKYPFTPDYVAPDYFELKEK